jgi:hypothetical protein
MFRHYFTKALGMLLCLSLVSCASIVSKSSYPISFTSEPNLATIIIRDETGHVVHEGMTPTTVTLLTKRGYFKGKNYTVVFKKEGYADQEMAIKRGTDGWYLFGNLLFGGLVGWLIVDPITGAMWTLPKEITGTLTASGESQLDQASLTVATIDDVPMVYRDQLVPCSRWK